MSKRIDITKDRVFFTADTHFHHIGILGHTNRPFADVEEMNATLIANWNAKVSDGDLVFHLGDFLLYKNKLKDYEDLLVQLNGRIILIRGNHDWDNAPNQKVWGLFHECYDYLDLSVKESEEGKYTRRVTLSHYPLLTWRGRWTGGFSFHGHSHHATPLNPLYCQSCGAEATPVCRRADVGVDCWGYAPVSYETLRDMLLTVPF